MKSKNLLITGGAGFIGSHVVRLLVNKYSEYQRNQPLALYPLINN